MRSFSYRAPRYSVDIPVRVTQGGASRLGRCTEISTDGMKVAACPFVPNSSGSIQIDHEELSLELPFRTVYSALNMGAVEFTLESDEQKQAVDQLILLVSAPRPCRSMVLVR